MRTLYSQIIVITLFLIIGTSFLQAQVKIGNQPQNINISSILELESTTKAFIITRVNTVQMNAITPLEGAMVYNTDAQCLHYFDGAAWINICEAFANNLTFSSNSLANPGNFETIKITPQGNNYNFEVGLLNASNIQDGTIDSPKIVNGAITLNKLGNNSVNSIKIANGSISQVDMAPGLPNTILQTNGGSVVEWTPLNVDNITGKLLSNELASTGDTSITITNGDGATLKNTQIRVTDLGITNVKIADGAVENVKLGVDAVTSDKILDGTVATLDIADNAVTNAKIAADAVTIVKIGTVAGDENKILGTNASGDPEWQDASTIATNLGEDVISTNGSILGTALDAALVAMDLEVNVDNTTIEVDGTNGLQIMDGGVNTVHVANDAITTGKILNETILSEDIEDGTIANDDLQNKTIAPIKLADGTAADQILRFDGTDWELIDQSAIAIAEADGIIGNEVVGVTTGNTSLIRSGTGITGDEYTLAVNTAGITDNELATDAVTSDKILDDEIVNADINSAAAIDGTKINPDFGTLNVLTTGTLAAGNTTITGTLSTTDEATIGANTITNVDGSAGQILTTDGLGNANWQDNSTALPTLTDAQILISDGTDTNARTISGDATITNTGVITIANNAINNVKIADDAVTIAKIGTTGAADGNRVLKTDATGNPSWQTETTELPTLADTQVIISDGTTANARTISGDATITNTGVITIGNNAINNVKIADDAVTIAKIGTTGAANGNSFLATDNNGDPLWLNGNLLGATLVDNQTVELDGSSTPIQKIRVRDGGITSTKIFDGTILDVDVSGSAAIAGTKINPNFGTQNISTTGTLGAGNTTIAGTLGAGNTTITGTLAVTGQTTINSGAAGATTLPTNAGTANQVLTTNGAGAATWEAPTTGIPTGTVGSIFFSDGAGNLAQNNSQLFWDTGNNRLGIGTNSPDSKFQVTGEIRGESFASSGGTAGQPAYSFYTGTDTDTGMYRPAADEIGFSVGGIEALHIDEITSTTTVTIREKLKLEGTLEDINNSIGTSGQVLTSTGAGTEWQTPTIVREVADEFTATAGQTIFTLLQTPSMNSKVKMYIDGLRVSNSAYSVSGNTVTYLSGVSTGQMVQFDYYY